VGFGKRNTAALEVRTEDSDDAAKTTRNRRGTWRWGIIIRNALDDRSTVLMCENHNGTIARGIDFDASTFSDGALRITGGGAYSGVIFDGGDGGQIFTEQTSEGPVLHIRAGKGGIRFSDHEGNPIMIGRETGPAE